jgi:NAD(P)-dependent dehydrogenase (short-subunit alcohol dehydrogenase family)
LCRGFAEQGMRLLVADIDRTSAEAVAGELPDAIAHGVDVADATAVAQLADVAFTTFGSVDLLCNNAGVFQGGLSWERSTRDWDWTLGVNLYGIIHAINAFVPRMLAQGTDGHIVNTASVAAFVSGPFSSPYVVSKAAAFALSECLAHDLASVQSRIGVSVLVPSAINTAIADTARVRPTELGTDTTEDGRSTADYLRALTATGIDPTDVVAPVLDAIRTDTFVIPTKPSYTAQIQSRYDGLIERRLPEMPAVD